MARPGDAAMSGALALGNWWDSADNRQWVVDDEVAVAVDGTRVWDADRQQAAPAVVMRMPAHFARHLAAVLDDWSTIGRLLESSRGAEQRDLAKALHEAARAAESLSGEDGKEELPAATG
jgi:hypothetical protein